MDEDGDGKVSLLEYLGDFVDDDDDDEKGEKFTILNHALAFHFPEVSARFFGGKSNAIASFRR